MLEFNRSFLTSLIIAGGFAFCSSIMLNHLFLRLGPRLGLMCPPTVRRRHLRPTPVTGGIGVMGAWFIGIGVFSLLLPQWFWSVIPSLCSVGFGLLLLMGVGIWDDVWELGAITKLFIQTLAAVGVLLYEPNIHALLTYWEQFVGLSIWGIAFLWIVGITNSINLIDGLDGLAGGISMLVAGSIFILSSWVGVYAQFPVVSLGMLIPVLLAFLFYNWHPAKIFLGDHGSLPVGFLLATSTLMGYAQSKSWIMILSMVLMLGYPMIDMGLCVIRRYRTRFPIFKADRSHIHFRILRLGLTVPETTILLFCVAAYLQITAISINLMDPPTAALGIAVVAFSLLSFLFLIRAIERGKVGHAFSRLYQSHFTQSKKARWIMSIDLSAIFENTSQASQAGIIIGALEILLRSMIRQDDLLAISSHFIIIHFSDFQDTEEELIRVRKRFQSKLNDFVRILNLDCITSGIPIHFEKRELDIYLNRDDTVRRMKA